MEISELKPVTKTYTQFKLDSIDTPTAVKNVLNKNMAFGQVNTVVKSTSDEDETSFKIAYYKDLQRAWRTNNLEISSYNTEHPEAVFLIINDYDKKITTLTYTSRYTSVINHSKVAFIEEDSHKVFLLPEDK